MKIFEIFECKKSKELKKYLKSNNIEFGKVYGNYFFSLKEDFGSLDVAARTFRGSIVGYECYLDDKGFSYDEKVDKILELEKEFTEKFGKPEYNSTNHFDRDNLLFQYNFDDVAYRLQCQKVYVEGNERNVGFIGMKKKFPTVKAMSDNSIIAIVSMIGGIVWGVLMDLITSAFTGKNSLLQLGVWVVAGIIFGALMCLVFTFVNKHNKKKKVVNKKLTKHFSLDGNLYPGIVSYFDKRGNLIWRYEEAAVLKMNEDNVGIYSVVKKEDLKLEIGLKELYHQMLSRKIEINCKFMGCMFSFKTKEDAESIENMLYEKLIDKSQEEQLFNSLKEETIKFNPLSIYDVKDKDFLDEKIKRVTKMLLSKDNLSRDQIGDIIGFGFLDSYYSKVLVDIYKDVYEKTTGSTSDDFFG